MPRLQRGEFGLHYEVNGRGPVLLLSHGYGATSGMWAGQIEGLSRDHTLVLWDMRGHGQSDSPQDPSDYSEAATVADMAAILNAAGADRAVIGGLSLGGTMSLAFHAAHPARVSALLIVDSGPGFRRDEARAQWNEQAARTAARLEARGLDALEPAGRGRLRFTHRSAEGLAKAARGMLAQQDGHVVASLPSIAVPTLIVVGADDAPFLAAADYMAARIPGARKAVIPDASHYANLDRPEAFERIVSEFLAAIER